MPTIGTKPSLRSTQAVGAVLLHQFARERFAQAGIDESLIREAEDREHINDLTAVLLNDVTDPNVTDTNLNTSQSDLETSTNARNISNDRLSSTTNGGEEFHSLVDSPNNSCNDRTIYHSITAANQSDRQTNLDQLESMPCLASYGRELRRIADEFEKTRLRQTVRDRAEQIKFSDIKRESFVQLLEELFQDKITREKIVILFLFCTDVALRAANFAQELVIKLMGWSFSYIIDTVCRVVYSLGGWDKVLFYQLPSVLISCCAILGIFTLGVYLRRSLKS